MTEWLDARRAIVRARTRFEPSADQRRRALNAETELLLLWAAADLANDRFRSAFARAEEAVRLGASPGPDAVAEARRIQSRALELGTVVVAVLPVTSTALVLDAVGTAFETQLADDLELDFWREPPPFVAVVDPVLVRREVRRVQRARRALATYEVADVLASVGAELGALIEFTTVTFSERDVERETRQARTRAGRPTTYYVEEGRLVLEVSVQVIVVGPRGGEVAGRTLSMTERGRFERGVFAGNLRDLNLSRNELRLFDADVLAEQRAVVEQELLFALVPRVADRVFDAVLSRVP